MSFDPLDHDTPTLDIEALVRLISILDQPKEVVEVGSWAGRTAIAMADAGGKVFCIDTWLGNKGDRLGEVADRIGPDNIYLTFRANCGARLLTTIFPERTTSLLAAAMCWQPLALVFIDAEHTYEACHDDIRAWWPHLREGGIMAVHDYRIFDGVTQAVDDLLPGHEIAGYSVAWIRKQAPSLPTHASAQASQLYPNADCADLAPTG